METFVPAPARRPRQTPTYLTEAIHSLLRRRVVGIAPGAAAGLGVYVSPGHARQTLLALLVFVLGPPAVAAGRVLARWVELLEPPRRWRRPRRRGS
jgi:hypothetical protein